LVVGVDGWRGGWVAVELVEGAVAAVAASKRFRDALARFPHATVVGVDIPIGLPERPPRAADVEAQALLGPRRSSVFHAPPRCVATARSYAEANQRSRAECGGRGLSRQAFALLPRILEVEQCLGAGRAIYEVHPELAFFALTGAPMADSKKTWAGQHRRRRALEDAGLVVPDELGSAGLVPPDDILDATAVAWSARRIAAGNARRVPSPTSSQSGDGGAAIWF
jgi:predicted RNase H-like nuclease